MIDFHKKNLSIGLDVDDVICDFRKGYSDFIKNDVTKKPHFLFSYKTMDNLEKMDASFWLDLPPKVDGSKLSFLPSCYISSRSIDVEITEKWLEINGFPCVKVIHTKDSSKLKACIEFGIDVFIDDYIKNFQELHVGGIETILMDASHNRQYNVDPYRLYNLNDLPEMLIKLNLKK